MKSVVKSEKYGEILVEENFWTGKKAVSVNGTVLQKVSKNIFQLQEGVEVILNGNYLKGLKLTIESETITVTPTVKWYEVVLSVLPFILVMVWGNTVALCNILPVVGGALGGAVSAVFSIVNLFFIKGIKNVWLKILISVIVIAITFAICMGIGFAIVNSIS